MPTPVRPGVKVRDFATSANGAFQSGVVPGRIAATQDIPVWDKDLRVLAVRGVVVKQFRVPASNQELILDAFQELGWPPHIDDPLPPHPEQDSKQRLHDTIDRLNRSQGNRLIRFRGNGNGTGILWELIAG
jgi:hypothetical protein